MTLCCAVSAIKNSIISFREILEIQFIKNFLLSMETFINFTLFQFKKLNFIKIALKIKKKINFCNVT
jgi:hypothetical protein